MSSATRSSAEEIEGFKRRLQREHEARLESERIAETSLRHLYERQQELLLLEAIAISANESNSVNEAFKFAITQVCQFKDWPVGHAFLRKRSEAADCLVSAGIWHMSKPERLEDFRRVTESTEFRAGIGLPGRVWESGKPAWIIDISRDSNFPRIGAASSAGLKAAFAFPILVGNDVTAVLEFFAEQVSETEPELLRLSLQIGTVLGRVVERKRAEEQLLYEASHDPLTRLPNRALFRDRLARAIARSKRHAEYHYAVLFIDLDHFKIVNDSLGHVAGDVLLVQTAARLAAVLREGDMLAHPSAGLQREEDTLARLGGDEFIILLEELNDPRDCLRVADRLQEVLKRAFDIEGREVYSTASIGIALSTSGYTSANDVLRDADLAMYRAKNRGRARSEVYDQALHSMAMKRLSMEAALRHALEHGEFLLHYQPKMDIRSGAMSGFEALLRWQRPGDTLVSPVEFIPVLEESGLIAPVGEWVLVEVCRQIKAWLKMGLRPMPVAVNLSARQFQQKNLASTVSDVLARQGLDPALMEIEITESLLMNDADKAIRTLAQFRDLGVKISIDDFGTGYSSLAYLKRFPLDSLKIDRAFVRDLATDADDAAITKTIISLAHNLKLDVVAEGVETEAQLGFLHAHGCDVMQGYYFCRPASATTCEAMMREDRRLIVP